MKTKSKIRGYILRGSAAALLFSGVIVAVSSAINLSSQPPKFLAPGNNTAFGVNGHESAWSLNASTSRRNRTLTFVDRVAYQRLIEEVYWRHRIWPTERPDRKPSLDAVISQATIEQKVQDYLRNSELLEQEWQKPITPEQLQAEMDRMAQHSKQPEVLHELFAALGNDPFVIAECLARPVLAERFANGDPVAAEPALSASRTGVSPALAVVATPLRGVAQNVPPAFAELWRGKQARGYSEPHGAQVPMTMAAATANYTLPAISDGASGCIDDSWTATSTTNAPTARYGHTAVWTGTEMIVWGGLDENFVFLN